MWHENVLIYIELYNPLLIFEVQEFGHFISDIVDIEAFVLNPLKTNRRPLYLKTQSVPRCKHFSSRLENQSVYAVSGISRCLFSDKYKTHKYSVDRAYNC